MESGMVLPQRFELWTSPLPRECSTPELRQHLALDGGRPRGAHTCQTAPADARRFSPDRQHGMIGAACGMAGEAGRAATREARVTDRRGDGAGERPAPGPEPPKPAAGEPSAAERRCGERRSCAVVGPWSHTREEGGAPRPPFPPPRRNRHAVVRDHRLRHDRKGRRHLHSTRTRLHGTEAHHRSGTARDAR